MLDFHRPKMKKTLWTIFNDMEILCIIMIWGDRAVTCMAMQI